MDSRIEEASVVLNGADANMWLVNLFTGRARRARRARTTEEER
jgi:hypothetical protein